LSLNLLAFLFHTVLDLVNYTYQKTRELLVTRTSFFNNIRTLLKFIWFKNWLEFFSFILTEYVPFKNVNILQKKGKVTALPAAMIGEGQ
jgi:hypothetical protein